MSGIHEAFKGYVPYQFTTLKVGVHAQMPKSKLVMRFKFSFDYIWFITGTEGPTGPDCLRTSSRGQQRRGQEDASRQVRTQFWHGLTMNQPFSACSLCMCAIYIPWSVNLTQTNLAVSFFSLIHSFSSTKRIFPLEGALLASHCQIFHSLSFLILCNPPCPSDYVSSGEGPFWRLWLLICEWNIVFLLETPATFVNRKHCLKFHCHFLSWQREMRQCIYSCAICVRHAVI